MSQEKVSGKKSSENVLSGKNRPGMSQENVSGNVTAKSVRKNRLGISCPRKKCPGMSQKKVSGKKVSGNVLSGTKSSGNVTEFFSLQIT